MYKVVYFSDYGNVVARNFDTEAMARAFKAELNKFAWIVQYTTSTTITDITVAPESEET